MSKFACPRLLYIYRENLFPVQQTKSVVDIYYTTDVYTQLVWVSRSPRHLEYIMHRLLPSSHFVLSFFWKKPMIKLPLWKCLETPKLRCLWWSVPCLLVTERSLAMLEMAWSSSSALEISALCNADDGSRSRHNFF